MNCIEEKKKGAFFVDGRGGTGKSFLYRALLATVRSRGCIALATATSDIAASILPGGRTTHSRFKIPIDLSDVKFCSISKQSCLGSLIRESKLIVWDEAPMAKRDAIEALNLALKDLCCSDEFFGGKVIVFGGNFRQVLPVLRRATKDETIGACLSSSYIWPLLTKLKLVENMRARLDPLFTEMLLRIENGQERTYDEDLIKIPPSITISECLSEDSLDELIRIIYLDLAHLTETELSVNRAILTTKNTFVDEVNTKLINEFPGDLVEYLSFDKVENPAHEAEYGDLINLLTPSGIPEHRLRLKKNAPVILLRNLDPTEGLCNGTRLICKQLDKNVTHAQISVGDFSGKSVFIHRILFEPLAEEQYLVFYKRIQSVACLQIFDEHVCQGIVLCVFAEAAVWPNTVHCLVQAPSSLKIRSRITASPYCTKNLLPGTQVAAVAYNNNIWESLPLLQLYKRYYVSGATLNKADPKYHIGSYQFSWTITNRTLIQPCDDDMLDELDCHIECEKVGNLHRFVDTEDL
ncbi:PIF1 helicase [Striga hermonthica]|uniref:ATP-dependent DNA helicase n=1 Tax=Striga hermonthica TaxID=68872 RepID=A0A9N7MQX7_STRHE|nr:PIF1 helicase [Striga hermonthica]